MKEYVAVCELSLLWRCNLKYLRAPSHSLDPKSKKQKYSDLICRSALTRSIHKTYLSKCMFVYRCTSVLLQYNCIYRSENTICEVEQNHFAGENAPPRRKREPLKSSTSLPSRRDLSTALATRSVGFAYWKVSAGMTIVTLHLHMVVIPGQQGRNSRPVRAIIGGQFAA